MKSRLVGLMTMAAIWGCYESTGYSQNAVRTTLRELPSRGFSTEPARSESVSSQGPMTLEQVQELVRAGLDDSIIARVVRERGLHRPLAVEDLLMLRRNGVSNQLIGELQNATAAPANYTASPAAHTPAAVNYREPAPVIVQPVPRYYLAPPPPVYVHAPYYYHYPSWHHHHHGCGRLSFGFSF